MQINLFNTIKFNNINLGNMNKNVHSSNNLERVPSRDVISFGGVKSVSYGDDETEKMLSAMRNAHETIAFMRSENPEVIQVMDEISNGDEKYAQIVMGISEMLFKPFDNRLQNNMLAPMLSCIDTANAHKYGKIVPRELNVDKNTVLSGLKVKNQKEFEEMVNTTFTQSFNTMIKSGILTDMNLLKYLPKNKQGVEFYKDLRKYCALTARNEAKCYLAECNVAKNFMDTEKSLNIDIFPIYYGMLAGCLEKDNTFNIRK